MIGKEVSGGTKEIRRRSGTRVMVAMCSSRRRNRREGGEVVSDVKLKSRSAMRAVEPVSGGRGGDCCWLGGLRLRRLE